MVAFADFELSPVDCSENKTLNAISAMFPDFFARSPLAEVAVNEAITNAVQHSTPNGPKPKLEMSFGNTRCAVKVSNIGNALELPKAKNQQDSTNLADLNERGRGLGLMQTIADNLIIRRHGQENSILMTFAF